MREYEVIHEIFNQFSGNQMRDVYVTEEQIDDVDSYMNKFRVGKDIQEDSFVSENGTVIYDLVVDGLKQRVSFSEI